MAKVSSEDTLDRDPEQDSPFGALLDTDEDDDLQPHERLAAKTVVIGGETIRRGDRKVETGGMGGGRAPAAGERVQEPVMRASPEPGADDEGVAELKRQLAHQQNMTNHAAQIAKQEHDARVAAEKSVATSNVSMVDQAIEAAKRDSEQARSYFQQALDRGDHKAAADAQILIADARANLLRLAEMREGLATEAAQPRQEAQPGQRQQPRQQQITDPAQLMQANVQNLSGHLASTGFPKSAEWIRSHPEMVRDRQAINKVDGAHSYAVNTLGLIPETDAYFDKIEELLGVGEPGDQTRMPMNTRQGQRQAPQQRMNMGAPARADAPNLRTGRVRGQQVALTSRQREHARDVLGMTDEEYAAELVDAQSRGKILGARA